MAKAPITHLTLPDDLALIELHPCRALTWKYLLDLFDGNGWNHPEPSCIYLFSLD